MHIVVTTANKNPATDHHRWRENVCLQLQLCYFSYFWFMWISAETSSHAKDMNYSRARAYSHQPRKYVYHHHTSMMIKYIHMCLDSYTCLIQGADAIQNADSHWCMQMPWSGHRYCIPTNDTRTPAVANYTKQSWLVILKNWDLTSTKTTNTHERPYQCPCGI